MEAKQVQALIDLATKPLNEKILFLEAQNQSIKKELEKMIYLSKKQKTEYSTDNKNKIQTTSKQRNEVKSPYLTKTYTRPQWRSSNKLQKNPLNIYKCRNGSMIAPPPIDKPKIKPLPPKPASRNDQKDKKQTEKITEPPKIKGGQKMSENIQKNPEDIEYSEQSKYSQLIDLNIQQ